MLTYIKSLPMKWLLMLFLVIGFSLGTINGATVLRVGYIPVLTQLPLIVSFENDHLNLKNLKLTISKYNSYTAAEAAIRVGAIDIASLPLPIVFNMAADGIDIKIIGICHTGGSRLVLNKEGNLNSLKGMLIGVPGLDSAENLNLLAALDSIKLRHGLDVKTIGVSLSTAIHDLEEEKLNALYLPEPFGTIAEQKKIAFSLNDPDHKLNLDTGTVLIIRSDKLKENPEAVNEWLESLVRACKSIEHDINESDALQTAIIQESYFSYPKNIIITALKDNKSNLHFEQFIPDLEVINKYMQISNKMKILTKSINVNELVHFDPMKRVIK